MRRALCILVVVVVGLGLGVRPAGRAAAQRATPAAPFPPGVTAQPLALDAAAMLPTQADFELFRWTLAPGARVPDNPVKPAVALVYVESGALTVRFATPLTITRGTAMAVLATPGVAMPPPEQVAADATATLQAGDSFVAPLHARGELRNDGTAPVVFLTALVTPPAEAAPTAATPAA